MTQRFAYDGNLESGQSASFELAYSTYGKLDADGMNCILLPGYYTGTCASYDPIIGHGLVLDPTKWFIITCGLFGNGESTITTAYGSGAVASIDDNVVGQKKLLDHLGVRHVKLVAGWSMGGMQAFAWARMHPEFVSNVLPICATASCHTINQLFLQSIRPILETPDGDLDESPHARDLFGRQYATWAYSDEFFATEEYKEFGYESADDVLEGWGRDHVTMQSQSLYDMLLTWASCIAKKMPSGHWKAKPPRLIAMPGTTDQYFLVRDAARDAKAAGGICVPLESNLGHIAGRPGIRQAETEQIARVMSFLLNSE